MLVLRLQRTGKRNDPTFRIVAAEKRRAVKGKCLEVIGHYLPTRNPVVFVCDQERVSHWVSQGAQPSNTLARLLTKEGMPGLEKFIDSYTKKKKRNAEEVSDEPAVTSTPAPATEENKPKEEETATEPEAPAEPVAKDKPAEEAPVAQESDSKPETETPPAEEDKPKEEESSAPETEKPQEEEQSDDSDDEDKKEE